MDSSSRDDKAKTIAQCLAPKTINIHASNGAFSHTL
jgi:hypothetical protein